MALKSQQRGMTFIGLLFVGGVLAFFGVVAAQVVPTALEYNAILRAANKAAKEGNTVQEVRNVFDKASAIDDFKAITGRDLDVAKEGDKVVVSFAYNKEIHLGGPAYLLIKYEGKTK
jgi:type II secretory pathway pseudopilin PulG